MRNFPDELKHYPGPGEEGEEVKENTDGQATATQAPETTGEAAAE